MPLFLVGFPPLKPNSWGKGTLLIKGLLGNLEVLQYSQGASEGTPFRNPEPHNPTVSPSSPLKECRAGTPTYTRAYTLGASPTVDDISPAVLIIRNILR